ncbi:MAG TPA: hypothetical protein VN428_26665 [Bryobacteraceae bacterium]|nr:hypothetical protein [Bryobacteraceae bacterium]
MSDPQGVNYVRLAGGARLGFMSVEGETKGTFENGGVIVWAGDPSLGLQLPEQAVNDFALIGSRRSRGLGGLKRHQKENGRQ